MRPPMPPPRRARRTPLLLVAATFVATSCAGGSTVQPAPEAGVEVAVAPSTTPDEPIPSSSATGTATASASPGPTPAAIPSATATPEERSIQPTATARAAAPSPSATAAPEPATSPAPTSEPTPTPTPQPSTTAQPASEAPRSQVFALVGQVELWLVSERVEVIGYHQSNHDGAQQMSPQCCNHVTMEDRGRDTASRGAADVALPKDVPIYSPATGTVIRGGTYTLYCEHKDDFLVIEPDGMPGIEVKLLHISGLQVGKGDRVIAGQTLIAPSATVLPFESQVNDHTASRDTPHVHIEVVDTSIPDRPSEGGGC